MRGESRRCIVHVTALVWFCGFALTKKETLKPLKRRESHLGLEHRDIGEEFDVFFVSFYFP